MADLTSAAAEVRALARTFQSVINLAAAVEDFASAHQAAAEAKTAVETLQAEAEELKGEVAAAKAEVVNATAQASAILTKAQDEGSVERVAIAKQVEADAANAAELRAEAAEEYKMTKLAHQREIDELKAKIKDFETKADVAEERYNTAVSALAALKSNLDN